MIKMLHKIRAVMHQYRGVGIMSLLQLFVRRKLLFALMRKRVVDASGMMAVKRDFWKGKETSGDLPVDIICVSGFGHSGSGAVLDLLSEYDDINILGHVDCNGSLRKQTGPDVEFSLLRGPGGLFQMEKVIASGSYGLHDYQVHLFLSTIAFYYYECGDLFGDRFIEYTRQFLERILLFRIPCGNGVSFSAREPAIGNRGSLLMWNDEHNFFYGLKNLDVHEFRRMAKWYFLKILPLMTTRKFLVLDQFVSDATGDIEKYEEYLGPIKVIAVHRDPRDVYATALALNVSWIPKDLDAFVKWYKVSNENYFRSRHRDLLSLRFEDMINDYQGTVKRISSFIGLSANSHVRALRAFDPSVSRKNVGLHKSVLAHSVSTRLHDELTDYCR